jgi:hypothetical protein
LSLEDQAAHTSVWCGAGLSAAERSEVMKRLEQEIVAVLEAAVRNTKEAAAGYSSSIEADSRLVRELAAQLREDHFLDMV